MSTTPTRVSRVFFRNRSHARLLLLGAALVIGLVGAARPGHAEYDWTTKLYIISPCSDDPSLAQFQITNNNPSTIEFTYRTDQGDPSNQGPMSDPVPVTTTQTVTIFIPRQTFVSFYYQGAFFKRQPTNDQTCSEIPLPENQIYINGVCSNSTTALYNVLNNNDIDIVLTIITGENQTVMSIKRNTNVNVSAMSQVSGEPVMSSNYFNNLDIMDIMPVTTVCLADIIPPAIQVTGDCYDDTHAYYDVLNIDTQPISFQWQTQAGDFGTLDLDVGEQVRLQTSCNSVQFLYEGTIFKSEPLPPTRCEEPPSITSASTTAFTVGSAGSFTVTTTGWPTPSLSEDGALPRGVTFADNLDGTATLAGTPSLGVGSSYPLVITASNGISPDAAQSFTLTVIGWARTTLSLLSSRNPAPLGYPVRFTARVAFYTRLAGVPTGTMEFWVDGTPQAPPVRLVSAQASSQPVTFTTAGPHVVLAKYSGDRNFAAATATLKQTVGP